MHRPASILCILVFGLLAAIGTARAESPTGTWSSTSGNVFTIPLVSGASFPIILTDPTGKKGVFQASWVEGMSGTQFTYGPNTCTFNRNDPDRIRVQGPSVSSFWTRIKAPQYGWLGILGTWQSDSGSTFIVADRGRTFHIIKGNQVIMAQWVEGTGGAQFSYMSGGSRVVATRNQSDDNRIRVESPNGKVNMWTRN